MMLSLGLLLVLPFLIMAQPLNGTYTIGNGGDFATLKAAFDRINLSGLTGNTTLKISDDVTESSSAVLNQWTESPAGSNFTLTIVPDGGARTVSGSINGALLLFNGADRVMINGLNSGGNALSFINTATTGTTAAIQLASTGTGNGCENVTIKNCTVKNGTKYAASYGIVIGGSAIASGGSGNTNVTIKGNVIGASGTGVSYDGSAGAGAGLAIMNNVIGGTDTSAASIQYVGIVVDGASAPVISGNQIQNIKTGDHENNAGINLAADVTNAVVTGNAIHDIRNTANPGRGSYGINIAASSVTGALIANNVIHSLVTRSGGNSTTNNPAGIRITGGANHKVYYNSVNMTGDFLSNSYGHSFALLVTSNSVTGLDVRNNVFANEMTGNGVTKSFAIHVPAAFQFGNANGNVYHVSGNKGVLGYYGTNIQHLHDWMTATGVDANSVSRDPRFNSSTDLMINTLVNPIPSGSDIGGALPVVTDFNSLSRDPSHPDAGAYEFTVGRVYSTAGTYTVPQGNIDNLSVSSLGTTVQVDGQLTVYGNLGLTAGTIDISSDTLKILGTLDKTNGDIQGDTLTVLEIKDTELGDAPQFVIPAMTVQKIILNRASGAVLDGDVKVTGAVNIIKGNLYLSTHNLTLGPTAFVDGGTTPAGLIITGAAGEFRKEYTAAGAFTFPIGDSTGTADYSPITLDFTSGTFGAGAYAGVRVINTADTNNSSRSNYLNRSWSVSQSNLTSFTCNVSASYTMDDVVGDETKMYTGVFNDYGWTKWAQANTATHTISATGVTSILGITGGTELMMDSVACTTDLTIALQGPWNGTDMSAFLNSTDSTEVLLPITQPFNDPARWSYNGVERVYGKQFFADHPTIVDWILVEMRTGDPDNPPMATAERRAGFVLQNGSIVDLDAQSPLKFTTLPPLEDIFDVTISRNHLPTMTSKEPTPRGRRRRRRHVFTLAMNQAFSGNGAPMVEVSPGVFAMAAGDANADGVISSSDYIDINNNMWLTGYMAADINLDGIVDGDDYTDVDNNLGMVSQVP